MYKRMPPPPHELFSLPLGAQRDAVEARWRSDMQRVSRDAAKWAKIWLTLLLLLSLSAVVGSLWVGWVYVRAVAL
jgi:hypothetical protein